MSVENLLEEIISLLKEKVESSGSIQIYFLLVLHLLATICSIVILIIIVIQCRATNSVQRNAVINEEEELLSCEAQ